MNDWYPILEAKRYSFPHNFAAATDEACTKLGVPATTLAAVETGANAWLTNYPLHCSEGPRPTQIAGRSKQCQYYVLYTTKDQFIAGQSPTASVVVGEVLR